MRELAPCSWASMIEMALWSFMIKVVRDGPKLLDGSGQGDPRPNKVVGGSIPDHGIISLATWRKTSQVVKCLPPAFQKNKRSLMVKKKKKKNRISLTRCEAQKIISAPCRSPWDAAFVGDMTGLLLCLHPPPQGRENCIRWPTNYGRSVGISGFGEKWACCLLDKSTGEATRTLHD